MPEYQDLNSVLSRAREAKVEAILCASFDLDSSRSGVELSRKQDLIYSAIGIHPHHADQVTDAALNELRYLAADPNVVAIGEMGLDYYQNEQPWEVQQAAFRKFLQLAQDLNKPAIIHCRDAQEDLIKIMKEENKGGLRGVFHCFAGDDTLIDFAKAIGFYISFTGNVTFKKAHKVRENVAKIPLANLLLETDCPYLAPEPFRGKRNEPAYVHYIAQAIAKIKGVSLEEVAKATTQNAKDLFKI